MTRRHPPGPRPLHWTLLYSTWAHLVTAALVLALARRHADGEHIDVMLLDPGDLADAVAALSAEDRPARTPRPRSDARSEDPAGPPEGRAPPRPREAASAPPEPVPPEEDRVRVARTEARDAVEQPPERWDAESRWNTVSERPRRAPVSSDRPGPLVPVSQGEHDEPGAPTLERRAGDAEARSGNRPTGEPAPVVLGGGGGGRQGEGLAGGSVAEGGPRAAGGPAGGGRAGSPDEGARGAPPVETAPPGPDPERTAAVEPPAWWDPIAVRVDASSAPPASAAAAPVPLEGSARRDRPAAATDAGGSVSPAPTGPALPAAPAEAEGTRRVAAPGTADPAEELRVALGFGPLDRSKLAPRPAWAGMLFATGAADSSPQTAFEAPIDWRTSLSTRGTALGDYVQQIEEIVAERWRSSDLDPHLRAIGIAGDVTVRYVVRADGRVSDVRVVRSSGNPALDALAVRAIPPRLPRFPRDLEESAIHHQITLHYRNPLLGIEGG